MQLYSLDSREVHTTTQSLVESYWIKYLLKNILAVAVALKQCMTKEFAEYAHQVVKNAKALAEAFKTKGYTLATGYCRITNLILTN